jgi:DnaJ domain
LNLRQKYLDILNLSENASPQDIKHQFRLLAKKHHPDINPSDKESHKTFILLKEAHDYLIANPVVQKPFIPISDSPSKEAIRMERIRQARERLNKAKLREAEELKKYYEQKTSGMQWKIFRIFAFLSMICGCILLIEPLLPSIKTLTKLTEISNQFGGMMSDNVILIKTSEGNHTFVDADLLGESLETDKITIEKSFFFKNILSITQDSKSERITYLSDFSITRFYPFVTVLFFLPVYTYRKKELSLGFLFMYKFNLYFLSILFVMFLISDNRWLHLITLGFF